MTEQDKSKEILVAIDEEKYQTILKELEAIPSFAAAECYPLTDEQRAVMTNEASKKLKEYFEILKLDFIKDENTKDTPFRRASMEINELMIGRYTLPPRIEAFPADMYEGGAPSSNASYILGRDEIYKKLDGILEDFYTVSKLKKNKLLKRSEALLEQLDRLRDEHDVPKPDIQTIVCKEIDVNSLCSHHHISFVTTDDKDSKCIVAYIPTLGSEKALLGISKLQRVGDHFGRRPQIQEGLNWQIKAFVSLILKSSDVLVSFSNVVHYCEKTRGVKSHCGSTSSVVYTGRFKSARNREMVFNLTRK